MAVVVSDTSPIRALDHLGGLEWLQVLFGEIIVPPTVVDELEHPPSRFSPVVLSSSPFVRLQAPLNTSRVDELLLELDRGEAEAIALAEEIRADLVLIDERDGRAVATRSQLPVLGTIGILLRAKQSGLCPALRPLLDQLQTELGFYLSDELRIQILGLAGEGSP